MMPIYPLYCPICGAKKEVYCRIEERNDQKCEECGANLKVAIRTANVLSRGIPLRVRAWMRKRDL